jgi:flagellar biosynthesis/type III secretory pathway chaperone
MTPAAPLPSLAAGETTLLDLDAAQARVQALDALLQEEFEVLRSQAFDRLETLQNEKIALLEALQTTALQVAALPEPPQAWTEVIEALEGCRSAYRRNEMLVTRQIEVVGATLRSLQSADTTASVDLYDRLGQLSRRGGRRLYSEA